MDTQTKRERERAMVTKMIALGCLGLGSGAVVAVLSILPTVPFLLLAAFCFAKSPERLHT